MITASELSAIQSDIQAAMPDTVTIQRATRTSDGAGGSTATWSTLATVSGNLAHTGQTPPREMVVAERYQSAMVKILTLPTGTAITHGDRVVISGVTYEVAGTFTPTSYAFAVQVGVVEIE